MGSGRATARTSGPDPPGPGLARKEPLELGVPRPHTIAAILPLSVLRKGSAGIHALNS